MMQADDTMTEQKLDLSPEFIKAVQRYRPKTDHDLRVENWKPSLLGRVIGMFAGKRSN